MVENEIIMKKLLLILLLISFHVGMYAQTYSWERKPMDGSRTGVTASHADNVRESFGKIKCHRYIAPNGRVFKKNKGTTYEVAKLLIDAQKTMAEVKTVIAHSPKAMVKAYPESELSNWFIDALMAECEKRSGEKVDVGIANFGGIRANMPEGDVLLDDILSMFPFKNNLCYVSIKGSYLREVLEQMAATKFQVLGGVKCVAKDGKLLSATIEGKPIEDERYYGLATISFLLTGGDGFYLNRDAKQVRIFNDYIMDIMVPYVKQYGIEGRELEYHKDGRIQILND